MNMTKQLDEACNNLEKEIVQYEMKHSILKNVNNRCVKFLTDYCFNNDKQVYEPKLRLHIKFKDDFMYN